MNSKNLIMPITIFLTGAIIALGIFFGLKGQSSPSGQIIEEGNNNLPSTKTQQAKTSIDDDVLLGDKSTAKVAVVEFTDYECSFCKNFRDQTFDQIKEEYIDTGKIVFVIRDLPLPFHNPVAEQEAIAAECAGEEGDDKYIEYHDELYDRTEGNGKGVGGVESLVEIASDLGLNIDEFRSCIEKNKFRDEVDGDIIAAKRAGINGTPGFVVGILKDDGSVDGEVISGAQPFSVFQEVIEQYLNE